MKRVAMVGCAWTVALVACTGCSAGGPERDGATETPWGGTGGAAADGGVEAAATAGAGGTSGVGGTPGSGGVGGAGAAGGGSGGAGGSTLPEAGGAGSAGSAGAGGGSAGTGTAGYLHTSGARIVDADGHTVRLTGVSWFGMETSNFAPHGLWSRSLTSMLDQIDGLGFNSLRIPFCNEMLDAGKRPSSINGQENPDLTVLTPLELLDRVVEEAGKRHLKVILDRHRPQSGAQSELWYTGEISEQLWIEDWTMLAARYAGNPTVVGMDLHDEPHGPATWGDGNAATDWRLAAQKAGNAILAGNPDLLVIVEGVELAEGASYWWGGNLRAAGASPVVLSVPNRVVYSPHDYPASVFNQSWFSSPDYPSNLPPLWDTAWGYLVQNDIAPVWIGEFGTRYETQVDRTWLQSIAAYIQTNGLSFAFWSWNPNTGDTGGILQDDWQTVNTEKMNVLAPLLAPKLP